ncbi:hypothetical protein [Bordetella sp. N]|uniref:hypothetical protein n=1 Tax=Bordetella sp. N TaxID=1746199 RepID=UPI00070FE912|nr:hypothetical protein [Bordetella sp. N]ALM85841.1 hypothetical protein ASB57_25405 [Bordetella sp. N]
MRATRNGSQQFSMRRLTRLSPRLLKTSLLTALTVTLATLLAPAQAFQARPNCLTDQPPSVMEKQLRKTGTGHGPETVAQLSSAPLVLTVAHARLRTDDETKQSVLDVNLTPDSRQAVAQLTSVNVGRSVILRADGEVLTTVVIRGPIDSGAMSIYPGIGEHGLTEAKMKQIAQKLASGKSKLEISLLPRA